MKKSISLIAALAVLLSITFAVSVEGASAKTIKQKNHVNCYKVGNYVHCGSDMCTPVYKVNLKTKKVKKIRGRYKGMGVTQMKYYKKYLYFKMHGNGGEGALFRTNVKTNKVSAPLAKNIYGGFTVTNNKILVSDVWSASSGKMINIMMNLNGKNKQKTKHKVKLTGYHKTNAKGYKMINQILKYDDYGELPVKAKLYLKTPNNKKIYICTYNPSYMN